MQKTFSDKASAMKVFLNHIYEFQKGVRPLVLHTAAKEYCEFMTSRLQARKIAYVIQPAGNDRVNLFFGCRPCIEAIRGIVNRPLNRLTPEEDFILGTLLGYDLCAQCERYCKRKGQTVGRQRTLA